ncbi:hypothetical protein A1O1_01300 [Capronia coronata CBS 617.96]|uniref:NADH dehydrogenase [ubiquinone] 1 beta subcomplex subunit 11, mitochondrial n=1 Tax=Capronia coronata CBS 617.96 TaxID=1182541 RepID=W9ZNV3_9EURO|nr:uncharacterized protein A1O1_01300 [Capronia coronata CBS 617.96]EXJ96174.1 hypothetical protein A1O1_01300 [Capronia coronata CBS 617.96]
MLIFVTGVSPLVQLPELARNGLARFNLDFKFIDLQQHLMVSSSRRLIIRPPRSESSGTLSQPPPPPLPASLPLAQPTPLEAYLCEAPGDRFDPNFRPPHLGSAASQSTYLPTSPLLSSPLFCLVESSRRISHTSTLVALHCTFEKDRSDRRLQTETSTTTTTSTRAGIATYQAIMFHRLPRVAVLSRLSQPLVQSSSFSAATRAPLSIIRSRTPLRLASTHSATHGAAKHDDHGHGGHDDHFDPPGGWLWGERPGDKYEKEGWEPFAYFFVAAWVVAVAAYTMKEDTTIQTWALEEARRRLEKEGFFEESK